MPEPRNQGAATSISDIATTPIEITVDERTLRVEPGLTVAAALWNAGVPHLRRSVGGEPRAPFCAMGICYECRVTIDGAPHRRACLVLCRQGMEVRTDG